MKILLFDIETFPNLAYVWGKYDQNVLGYVSEWKIASFAWKWLENSKVNCLTARVLSERTLVENLHSLFDEADVLVAHNGDEFDIKKVHAKFLEYGLTPPSPSKSIDTKKVAKAYFEFNGNGLDDICKLLKIGGKKHTGGFDLWLKCMAGEKKSWKVMEEYNKQDVVLLEKIYLKMLPWIKNHPSQVFDKPNGGCTACGSERLRNQGVHRTNMSTYRRFKCLDCGKYSRSSKAEKSIKPKIVNL